MGHNVKNPHSSPDTSLSWSNLSCEVTEFSFPRFQKKQILDRLYGNIDPATVTALMGPSGAGKTTLLNCLCGNVSSLSADSTIYLNSDCSTIFIEQQVNESIAPQLTVREILRYAFCFKSKTRCSASAIDQNISKIATEMLFDPQVLDRRFGHCSGGEQKRVVIGQEIISTSANFSILFVDEPTTGLDSTAAFEVMNCLKQLTGNYRMAVIASMHQPNDETLALCDKLYVLAKGGVCIYSGPPKSIESCLREEMQMKIRGEQPPIEALMKIACRGSNDHHVTKLSSLFKEINQNPIPRTTFPRARFKPFSIYDLFLHFSRISRITFISNRYTFLFFLLIYFLYLTLLVIMFNEPTAASASGCPHPKNASCQESLDNQVLTERNVSFHTYVILYMAIAMACNSTAIFSSHIRMFRREHRNNWYSFGVFYFSSTTLYLFEMTLFSLFISTLTYLLSFQHAADEYSFNVNRFLYVALSHWLLCLHCQTSGQLFAAVLSPHSELATIASLTYIIFITQINGLFVVTERSANPLASVGATAVTIKYVTKCLLYSIYAVDRPCEAEENVVLKYFAVDGDQFLNYVLYILLYVVLLRVTSFAVIYCRVARFRKPKSRTTSSTQAELPISSSLNIELCPISSPSPLAITTQMNDSLRGKVAIAYRNLTLYGSSLLFESNRSPILRHLNGDFSFGSLNAIMGTSGAGKTTLLKVLNGTYKYRLSKRTRIYQSRLAPIETCFIAQHVEGHLMAGLTAQQSLVYASRLKNGDHANVDHSAIALHLLHTLGLVETADTKVDKCSGGERKRLALALELAAVRMPNLICIDEPTSGLDSNNAEIVISALHSLTQSHPLTIIASIHQPNSEILRQFDQLYILARGGVCIYSGPPSQVHCHLDQLDDGNQSRYPIEVLIKYSSLDHQHKIIQKLIEVTNRQLDDDSEEEAKLKVQTHRIPSGILSNQPRFSLHSVHILLLRYVAYIVGHQWKEQLVSVFLILSVPRMMIWFYDRKMFAVSGCFELFSADACFSDHLLAKYMIVTDTSRFNFFITIYLLMLTLLQTAFTLRQDLHLFESEHRNGWYSSGSFYLSKCILEVLPQLPIVLLYTYIIDYYEPVRPGIFLSLATILFLSVLAFQGLGHILALTTRSHLAVLILLCITCFITSTLLSNYIIQLSKMHYVFQFASQLSICRFAMEAIYLLVYGFGRCQRHQAQLHLYGLGLIDSHYSTCILMLLFNLLFYRLIAVWLLLRTSRR